MYLELYYDPTCEIFRTDPANEGFPEVPRLIEEVRQKGIEVEIMDTGKMSEGERREAYEKAAVLAVRKKYRVRQVFGSRRYGYGPDFGKGVPALLVYKEKGDQYPEDVYPHEREGKIFTIKEFLEQLLKAEE
ncbi:hypothetical protein HRbin08_01519 [bacterium HR08]|nr:hypothetical protein HRbin08_01519 [bacterium HR08]